MTISFRQLSLTPFYGNALHWAEDKLQPMKLSRGSISKYRRNCDFLYLFCPYFLVVVYSPNTCNAPQQCVQAEKPLHPQCSVEAWNIETIIYPCNPLIHPKTNVPPHIDMISALR
jgi:hypothetical protein